MSLQKRLREKCNTLIGCILIFRQVLTSERKARDKHVSVKYWSHSVQTCCL